jgi:hypothetical protein
MYKSVVIALVCMAIFIIFMPEFIYAAKEIEIALEAELANKIEAAVVIAVPADAEPSPNEPSRGKFIWAPGAPVTGGGDSGFAEFIVNIPQADTYAVWGHTVAWDGNSDSFWVTWRPADPDENPQQTGNTEYRWGVAQSAVWHWDRINHWLDAGTFDREWELPEGETILKIWSREDATMLDALFITNDDSADAGGANVRLPTDEDVEKQLEGTRSVYPMDKLSTTWGRIKSAQ